jgi:hypothetical protein
MHEHCTMYLVSFGRKRRPARLLNLARKIDML